MTRTSLRRKVASRGNLAAANAAIQATRPRPHVSALERAQLSELAAWGDERARAVLQIADGASTAEVARRLGLNRSAVHVWLVRWRDRAGTVVERLYPRCGRKRGP